MATKVAKKSLCAKTLPTQKKIKINGQQENKQPMVEGKKNPKVPETEESDKYDYLQKKIGIIWLRLMMESLLQQIFVIKRV